MKTIQWQRVKIQLDDHDKGRIWIDDKELDGTVGIEFHSQPGLPPLVTIRMYAEVEVESAAIVEYEHGRWMKADAIESGEVEDLDPKPKGLIVSEEDA